MNSMKSLVDFQNVVPVVFSTRFLKHPKRSISRFQAGETSSAEAMKFQVSEADTVDGTLKSGENSPVEVGSLFIYSIIFKVFLYIPGGWEWDF